MQKWEGGKEETRKGETDVKPSSLVHSLHLFPETLGTTLVRQLQVIIPSAKYVLKDSFFFFIYIVIILL